MTPERWQRIKQVALAALDLEAERRAELLEKECGSDSELRGAVEALLEEDRKPEGSVERAIAAVAAEVRGKASSEDGDGMLSRNISHYKITDKLGEGGMGVVYKAEDTKLRRPVALKFLRSDVLEDEEHKERFLREAQAAAALDHSNICTVYEIDEADGQTFLSVAYLEGETVKEKIKNRPLKLEDVLDIAIQTAQGLQAAHEKRITHRDIKSANLMVTGQGQVKVMDFGLAQVEDRSQLTKTGSTLGTPAYMSPEQAQAQPTDRRTDIWSLGVVLYEMLTGQLPFKGGVEAAVAYAVVNTEPEPPTALRSGLPVELDHIVDKALAKKREERYQHIEDMLVDLRAVRREVVPGDLAARQSRLEAFDFRGVLRKRKVAVPALLVLLALTAAGTWFGVRSYRTNWARTAALPEINRLLEQEDFDAAFRLGQQAARYIPDDPTLLEAQQLYALEASVSSTPPGADVYVKGYRSTEADWLYIGKTPIDGAPVPGDYLRWRVTKEGLAPAEGASYSVVPRRFTLHPLEDTPSGMVPVPGGDFDFRDLPRVKLEDYWLDKYEVTNKQFQEFVDQGGYEKREYWKHPFAKDDEVLSWEEAMAEFLDTTGRPGPSTWELGAYPEGRDNFPVNGLSWYEAVAYADFAEKSLPTVYHWFKAALTPQSSAIIQLSNFGGPGPAQAGSHQGLSPYGSYDMAGNVREWCWNAVGGAGGAARYIPGASWSQPPYMFSNPVAADPFDRSAINGFRCARYDAPPPGVLTAPVERVSRDYTKEKPVDDEIFQVYRSFYSYERTDLEPEVEEVDDSALHWRREKVAFNAAYGGERVIAHLLLPRNAQPPYQTVVYFPSDIALLYRSSDDLGMELQFVNFLPRIGRAVLFLVHKGAYERYLDPFPPFPFPKDLVISWSRDFSRSIDYLETRPDIDHQNLGYFTFSKPIAPVMSAIDGRIKAGAHLGTGFPPMSVPSEYDPLHFAPRAKEPTLILGGRYDFILPVDACQRPMLRLLGAPEEDKRLVLFDRGHVVRPGPEVIKEVLDWFDRYLGPVETK